MAEIILDPQDQQIAVERASTGLDPIQQEKTEYGTWEDYMTTMSPLGMDIYNEDLTLDKTGNGISMTPEFKAVYDVADGETQTAMLEANNNMDAFKIYERRAVEQDAFNRIANDSIAKQLGVGMVAGSVSPTTLLPIGAVAGTMYKTALSASKAMHIAKLSAAGATTGGAAAVFDEALFESNGQHYDYGSALMYGMAFGGGLGMLVGLATRSPHLMNRQTDTYRTDYEVDPTIEVRPDGTTHAVGQEGIAQQNGIAAKIPGIKQITAFLDSDVAIAYKSKSQAVIDFISLVSPNTVAHRDSLGNVLPSRKAGTDMRRELMGYWNTANRGLNDDFFKMKESGGEYSKQGFFEAVDEHFAKTVAKQESDAYNYAYNHAAELRIRLEQLENSYRLNPNNDTIAKAVEKTRKEAKGMIEAKLDEFYKQKVDWSHSNPFVARGAQRYAKYFKDFSDNGKKMGMEEFLRQREGKLYKPRLYNLDKLGKEGYTDIELRDRFTRAFRAHRGNDDLADVEITELVDNVLLSLNRGNFNQNFTHNSFLLPNAPAGSRLAHRKFRLDERELGDFMRTDMNDVAGAYNHQMTGRQAVNYALGNDHGARTQELYDAIKAEGLSADPQVMKDVEAAMKAVEDLAGTLRLNTLSNAKGWQFTRTLMSYNSGRLGVGFGANQAIEGAATLAMNGVRNVFNSGFGRSLKDSASLMFGTGKDVSQFSEHMLKFGYMEDALSATRVNAIADTELGLNAGVVEQKLHGFNEWLQKWNGMRPLKAAMESNTAAATMSEITKLAKQTKFTDADLARMGRWGLDEATMRKVADDINTHIDPKNGKFDIHKFENLEEFQLAVSRGIEETVIQGNSIHMPRWMKDHTGGPMLKLLTQFMRFPLIAHNQLLKRGVTEDKARMGGSIVAGSMMYMSIKYMLEQAEIATGVRHEADTRYDYFGRGGEEALQKGLLESLNYSAATGMWSTGINYAANFTGHSELGRNYVARDPLETYLGPSAGLFKDSIDFATTIAQGDMSTDKFFLQGKTYLLMQNAGVASKAYDAFAEGL